MSLEVKTPTRILFDNNEFSSDDKSYMNLNIAESKSTETFKDSVENSSASTRTCAFEFDNEEASFTAGRDVRQLNIGIGSSVLSSLESNREQTACHRPRSYSFTSSDRNASEQKITLETTTSHNNPKKRRFTVSQQQPMNYPRSEFQQGQRGRRRYGSVKGAGKSVLPNKFLLGGNISDPLNLNSLYDDEISKVLNQRTPKSSPLQTPRHRRRVDVVIPINVRDPLNLNSDEIEPCIVNQLCVKKRKKYKGKKKEEFLNTSVKDGEKKKELLKALKIDIDPLISLNKEVTETMNDILDKTCADSSTINKNTDKIVSPVIPQVSPRVRKRRHTNSEHSKNDCSDDISKALFQNSHRRTSSPTDNSKCSPIKRMRRQTSEKLKNVSSASASKPKFIHGNYNRYYGYRNADAFDDIRLQSLKPEWFSGKDILDIGCNVGHLTLQVAKNYCPRKIIGIDIDGKLIAAARKNIRHYISSTKVSSSYPVSHALIYGPVVGPPVSSGNKDSFPNNIMFSQANYVLERDELLELQREEYDLILGLSLTKWIHLNNGDEGLKRAFKRMHRQLRTGGKLILEPQSWHSYKKRKKLTETIFHNFQNIHLKPEQFTEYLLNEVGFSTCEHISVPQNKSKGFRRPLLCFTKTQPSRPETPINTQLSQETSDLTHSEVISSASSTILMDTTVNEDTSEIPENDSNSKLKSNDR